MQLTISKGQIFLVTLFLTISSPEIILSQNWVNFGQNQFGQIGNSGQIGSNGENGTNGRDTTAFVDGKPVTYEIFGRDGTNGTNGQTGSHAQQCSAPRKPDYSLLGSSGGNGGNGGNGGDGGDGGDILLYYTNFANLKQVNINNSGGKGGQGGQGAVGGQGCACQETYWSINYCRWELWKKVRNPKPNHSSYWIFDSNYTARCTATNPSIPSHYSHDDYWSFKSVNQGISETKNFTCQSGASGSNGQNGTTGKDGNYGKITLVPRSEIPSEKTIYTSTISELLGKSVELVKNIWVEQKGLATLLASGSDVPNVYTYLENTIRLRYRLVWEAKATPQELGIDTTEISARIDLKENSPQVEFDIPGTLEYRIAQDVASSHKILTVTGGFAPDRVQAFEISSVSGIGANNQLVLVDRGRVRSLLSKSTIEVIVSSKESASGVTVADDYQERYRYTYAIPPQGELNTGSTEKDSVYTLNTGKHFEPWLKSGYRVRYEIIVAQVTKMGTVYTQTQLFEFVAQ